MNDSDISNPLTSIEVGKLWATYVGNSMSEKILTYFLQHCEDNEIKTLLENGLFLAKDFMNKIQKIFEKENVPIPLGFTENDVNLNAPRLYQDEFYAHYLKYALKAGMSIYSIAIPLSLRNDVKEFFIHCLESSVVFVGQINSVLFGKGLIIKAPVIPVSKSIDLIERQSYLNGYVGEKRPLHALEITHLYDNIENNTTSKALLQGFYQTVQNEKIKSLFKRGLNNTDKTISMYVNKFQKENLLSPYKLDHLVTSSDIPAFSDKLMLFHKVDMFSIKIRAFGNSIAVNGRRDLAVMYMRILVNNGLFVDDGANILIEKGWMETPPMLEKKHE
jgi:Protein of unknown function (DUF3231)